MRIGLTLPQYGIDVGPGRAVWEVCLGVAEQAERLGFDGVWLSDHPFAVAPDGTVSGALEPLVLLGALARKTRTVELGTLVLAATMRRAGLTAFTAGTLPRGRTTLGIGAGWYEPEHRAFGMTLPPFDDRVALVEEAVRAFGADRPRILIGGTSARLLDVAARHADAWNVSWDPSVEAFVKASRLLDEACARVGRDPQTIRRSVGLTVLTGATDRAIEDAIERLRGRAAFLSGVTRGSLEASIVVGGPAACVERIAAYPADEVVVAPFLRDDDQMIERIGTEIAAALRS